LARPGAYKSEKRKKELTRQKKQEKKRQRRLEKDSPASEAGPEMEGAEEGAGEVTEETAEPEQTV
jgi:hypothetical protein